MALRLPVQFNFYLHQAECQGPWAYSSSVIQNTAGEKNGNHFSDGTPRPATCCISHLVSTVLLNDFARGKKNAFCMAVFFSGIMTSFCEYQMAANVHVYIKSENI